MGCFERWREAFGHYLTHFGYHLACRATVLVSPQTARGMLEGHPGAGVITVCWGNAAGLPRAHPANCFAYEIEQAAEDTTGSFAQTQATSKKGICHSSPLQNQEA